MQIGAHVDQTDPIAEAQARGVTLVQFFLGDPQGYRGPEVRYAGGAEGLRADAEAAGIDLYVHAPYIVNVATTNNRIRIPSRKLLQQHVDAAAAIGARGLIVHGGHVNKDDDPEKGFDNWRKAVEATDLKLPLLIENTAGGDNAMTRHLDRIGRVWDAIAAAEGADQVGFCLDTCHAHAGGNALETVVDDVRRITGRVDLVHCNDSRDDFDSGADRHASLGHGKVDPDLLAAVVRDAGAPVVLRDPRRRRRAPRRRRLAARAGVSAPRPTASLGRVTSPTANAPLTVRATSEEEHLAFLRTLPSASFLQTPAWGRVKSEWRRESLGWFRDDTQVGAGLVLYRQLPRLKRYLAYLPEGPVIDWALTHGEDLADWLDPMVAHLRGAAGLRRADGPAGRHPPLDRRPGQGGHRRPGRAPPRRRRPARTATRSAPAPSPACASSAGATRPPRAASPPGSRSTSSRSR